MILFDSADFDAFATALPGVTLSDQWDSRVAKVGGKVFALLTSGNSGSARIVFKCGEDSFAVLEDLSGIEQAPYFAKRQWIAVSDTADLPAKDLEAYVMRSYRLVAKGLTRTSREELGIP